MDNFKLCYIDFVDDYCTYQMYFTDNYEDQWGDDWNDRPADCNAEPPYEDDEHHIVSMFIRFNWMATDIIFGGKTYAVSDMNRGGVPWLIFKNKDYTDYTILGGEKFMDVLTKLEISGVCEYWVDKKLLGYLCEASEEDYDKAMSVLNSPEEE